MQYTLKDRLDLMTKARRQNYLVLELDYYNVDCNTFYNMTASVQRTFGQKKFTYTWFALPDGKLLLFVAGNAVQLNHIKKYFSERITYQAILEANKKSQFIECVNYYASSIPIGGYVGAKSVGGTHFARVGIAA